MTHRLTIDAANTFKDSYFERCPVVVTDVSGLATNEEAFAALRRASDLRRQSASANIKIFIDGLMATESRHPTLPSSRDATIHEYQARLREEMAGVEFAVYCGSVQKYSPAIFDRARILLAHLFGSDWLPPGYIDLELFLGQYSFTPGGIHQEPRSNLHWVLAGHKDMLVWRPDTWKELDVPSVSQFTLPQNPQGTLSREPGFGPGGDLYEILNGGPTDLLYWPPAYWHVGRSPEFSVSINIAIFSPDDPFKMIKHVVSEALWENARGLGTATRTESQDTSTLAIPQPLQQQLQDLRRLVNSDALMTSLVIQWTKRVTGLGFISVPDKSHDITLHDDQELSRAPNALIAWSKVGDDLVYGANGHAGVMQFAARLVQLLELIESGQSFTLKQLVREFADASAGETLRPLVEDLRAMRAVQPAAPVG